MLLLPQIGDIDFTWYGDTLLHLAIYCRNPEIVLFLLENGADPNKKVHDGDPPLCEAIRKFWGSEIPKALLEKGADPNVHTYWGIYALTLASRLGKWDVATLLIERGADVSVVDHLGGPLAYAAMQNRQDMIETLLAKGAQTHVDTTKSLLGSSLGPVAMRVYLEVYDRMKANGELPYGE